jgi:hypothetical protein
MALRIDSIPQGLKPLGPVAMKKAKAKALAYLEATATEAKAKYCERWRSTGSETTAEAR